MAKTFIRKYFPLVLVLLLFSNFLWAQKIPVAQKQKNEPKYTIDLYSAYKNAKTYPLSVIAESVEYFPLETTKACLLGDYVEDIYFNSDGIFIFDYQYAYCFSKNGKFLTKIGKKGRGPGEYSRPMGMIVEPATKNIYFLDLERLLKYDYSGNFIKEYKLGVNAMKLLKYKEGIFLLDDIYYQHAAPHKRFSIRFYSEKEEKQIAKVDCPRKDKIPFSISFPIMYKFNKNTYLMDYWDNVVYLVKNPQNLNTYAILNKGKFKYRDKDDKSMITGKENSGEELVIGINNMSESDRFIFISTNKGLFFYDKITDKTQCCTSNKIGEKWYNFENNLTGGPTFIASHFPFHAIDNNTFVTFNNAYEFFEEGVDPTNPKIKKLMQNLQPDDNPVLVLVTLKE